MANIDAKVAEKFSKKVQSSLTYAEKDNCGRYHIVVKSSEYGEASFHETSIAELKWMIKDFLDAGIRY